MNAKKCDRCGNFYTKKSTNAMDDATKALERIAKSLSVGLTLADKQEAIEQEIDLCSECSKSLTRWLENNDQF